MAGVSKRRESDNAPLWPYATYAAVGLLVNELMFLYSRHESSLATLVNFFLPSAPTVPRIYSLIGGLVAAGVVFWLVLRGRGLASARRALFFMVLGGILSQIPSSSVAKGVYASTYILVVLACVYLHHHVLPALKEGGGRAHWRLAGRVFRSSLVLGGFLAVTLAATLVESFDQGDDADVPAGAVPAPDADLQSKQVTRHLIGIAYYVGGVGMALVPILNRAFGHPGDILSGNE